MCFLFICVCVCACACAKTKNIYTYTVYIYSDTLCVNIYIYMYILKYIYIYIYLFADVYALSDDFLLLRVKLLDGLEPKFAKKKMEVKQCTAVLRSQRSHFGHLSVPLASTGCG